jgi:hypothetical protein
MSVNGRPRLLDRLPNARNHVGSEVIHHEDVVWPVRRNQALLDIAEEHLSGHGALDDHRRGHSVVPQSGHEGDCLPFSRIQRRRARATSARCRSVACRLFLRVMWCRVRKRHSELRLVRVRRLRRPAMVSTKVRSGCSATRANTCAANSSSGETLPLRGFGAALLLSCQRCSHFYSRTHAHPECSAARRSRLHCFDNAFPQVSRIGLRHRPLRIGQSMPKDSLIFNLPGIPPIQIGREPL